MIVKVESNGSVLEEKEMYEMIECISGVEQEDLALARIIYSMKDTSSRLGMSKRIMIFQNTTFLVMLILIVDIVYGKDFFVRNKAVHIDFKKGRYKRL